MFSILFPTAKQVKERNVKFAGDLKKEVIRALGRGALSVQRSAIDAVRSPPKTGKIYKRGSVTHQASAPGEAPATDTGALISSIRVEIADGGEVQRIIAGGKGAPYAGLLEEEMNRPYMRPALEKNKSHIKKLLKQAIARARKG